jgi:hypothetical protein
MTWFCKAWTPLSAPETQRGLAVVIDCDAELQDIHFRSWHISDLSQCPLCGRYRG